MEILWKGTVSAKFWANRPKLCLSTKFPHQEIRFNYGILCSEQQMKKLLGIWNYLFGQATLKQIGWREAYELTRIRHESTRTKTSLTQINTSPASVNTNQSGSTRYRHESTRINTSSKTGLDHEKEKNMAKRKNKT